MQMQNRADKVAGEMEAVLEKQANREMYNDELRDIFKDEDAITYFSAISKLKRAKRLERVTEGKKIKYRLV